MIEKSLDYMRDVDGKDTAKSPTRPHTHLASELLTTVVASNLGAVTKNKVRADFVRVLTHKKASWWKSTLAENAQPKSMRFREVRNLIDSLLPARAGGGDESAPYLGTVPAKVVLAFSYTPGAGYLRTCVRRHE